jgi:hypothetical protein
MIILTVKTTKLTIAKAKKTLATGTNPEYPGNSANITEAPVRTNVATSADLTKKLGIFVVP